MPKSSRIFAAARAWLISACQLPSTAERSAMSGLQHLVQLVSIQAHLGRRRHLCPENCPAFVMIGLGLVAFDSVDGLRRCSWLMPANVVSGLLFTVMFVRSFFQMIALPTMVGASALYVVGVSVSGLVFPDVWYRLAPDRVLRSPLSHGVGVSSTPRHAPGTVPRPSVPVGAMHGNVLNWADSGLAASG